MFSIRKTVIGALSAIGILAGGTAAQAGPLTVLYLSIDESGSIGSTNFATQMNAYVSVLNSLIPTDSSIAIGVGTFSSGVTPEIAVTLIDSAATLTALTTAIGAITYSGGLTAIGDAINSASGLIMGYNFGATGHVGCGDADVNCIIDVSTDGNSNTGANPATAAATALGNGIPVNCLGIGGGANCSWATGFTVTANTFADVEAALRLKIVRETNGKVPEPTALLLIGLGLAGLGARRRRRAA